MSPGQIVIVGGGPAGLGAALEAARAGAPVTLIDERPHLGGQYYKQIPSGWASSRASRLDRQYEEGSRLIAEVHRSSVEVLTGTQVWSIFDDRTLALTNETSVWQLPYAKLVLTTGAQELPVALPGWTLPGVFTGGGAQSLVTSQGLLPGRHVLLAGVGPFQLRVAAQLVEAGAKIVGILDAAETSTSLWSAVQILPHWSHAREALDYLMVLRKAGARVWRSHLPIRILGHDRVERVMCSRIDAEWHPIPGTDVTFDVDAICLTYGFVPAIELARLAGCRVDYRPDAGGWVTWHDAHQATSVPDIFVAGEAGDIEGAAVALEEGRLAGLEAARQFGAVENAHYAMRRREIERELVRARRPMAIVRHLVRLKPGLFELMTDDTVVCRCEDVRVEEVREAARRWEPGFRGIKFLTRAGMGMCQSRICRHLVARLIADTTGAAIDSIPLDTPRPPVRPVPLEAMASLRGSGPSAVGAWHDGRSGRS
ncbi:MAG TPA: NAD(P)/FAD-dependent oxidoreductase [bacterium]|nr:NAD(P)/FAD-dependent oxidoreductase [bacterium]